MRTTLCGVIATGPGFWPYRPQGNGDLRQVFLRMLTSWLDAHPEVVLLICEGRNPDGSLPPAGNCGISQAEWDDISQGYYDYSEYVSRSLAHLEAMHMPDENLTWSNPFETEIPMSDDEDISCFVQVALAATGSSQGDAPIDGPDCPDAESAPAL